MLLDATVIKQLSTQKACDNEHVRSEDKQPKVVRCLVVMSISFYGCYLVGTGVTGEASRRLCNLSFVLYHTACVLAGLAMGALMDSLLAPGMRQENLVEAAVNYNQLLFFIGCNLLTGLINITMDTYFFPEWKAHLVMFAYYLVAVTVFSYLRKHKLLSKIIPG
jgi:drug/metabolite transporter (DMT)-like permease